MPETANASTSPQTAPVPQAQPAPATPGTEKPAPTTVTAPVIKPLVHKLEPETPSSDQTETNGKSRRPRKGMPKALRIFLITFGILILLIGGTVGAAAYIIVPPAKEAKATLDQLNVHAANLQVAAKQKDLPLIKAELDQVKSNLESFKGTLNKVSWAQKIPVARDYWNDAYQAAEGGLAMEKAGQIAVAAIEPYADFLGFKTAESGEPSSETAEDRIEFIVTTLDKIGPNLDEIGAQLQVANSHITQIDPNRYPEEFRGIAVRSQLTQLRDMTEQASVLITDARPLIEVAPYLLGIDEKRTYLVLFQNDAELRPTGGFLTAYSLLEVEKGQIKPILSSDMYDLDKKFNPPPAPEPILKYLPKVSTWNLRDMNLSPDFKASMKVFAENYAKTGSRDFDGIIAVDTKFLLSILEVIGPVGVSGYGNFSAEVVKECNCPQVIYELESLISYETPYIREERKAVLGPLMHAVLANAMGQPKEKMPALVETGLKAVEGKHVLMYFTNEEVQTAIESFNMAGRVRETDGDYLMVVDTNFAGAKSNLYVESDIKLEVSPQSDHSINTLTLTYKNPQRHDGWLNGDSPDWFRVYVPEGAKLIESTGSEVEVSTSTDLGKTVFDGFFVVRPQGLATIVVKYESPIAPNPYKILVQKQGGTKDHDISISVNGQTQETQLSKDIEFVF